VSTYTQASLQDQVAQLARVVMKHEDQINTAKLDRGFVLFLHNGEGSILQTLFDISQKTKQALDNGKAQENPLRILLLKALFVELEGRLKMLDNDPQALANAKKQGLLGDQGWFYKRWDRKTRQLVDDPQRSPLPSKDISTRLVDMFRLLSATTVLKFGASHGFHEELLEDPDSTTALLLEISLRGPDADALHQHFAELAGNAVWHLLGIQVKRDTLRRSGQARRLGEMALGWTDSSRRN